MKIYRFITYAFETFFELPLVWSVDYIEKHLRQELDFVNEAKNSEMASSFLPQSLKDQVYIPKIYWPQTSTRILAMEYIDGVPLKTLEKPNSIFNSQKGTIMSTLVKLFGHQIFSSGFLHCDPHQGNVLIRSNPKTGKAQVVLIDHGLYVKASPLFSRTYARFWKSLFLNDISNLTDILQSWGINDVIEFNVGYNICKSNSSKTMV